MRVTPPGPVEKELLVRMRDTMTHRGPDDEGILLDGPVGLGHRRLSIIDLSGGHQPMSNGDETLWVTYNGEIYNFREVRARLESLGYVFRTKSDTEVILHAYDEFGEQCVEHFRGMFAFALWDRRRKQLLLARDRLGIKPLYYTFFDGTFLFASEIKALLTWPRILREVDPVALGGYLRFRYVPGPRTMFRGISKLEPGHVLTIRDGKIATRQYWDVPREKWQVPEDAEGQLGDRLRESVRLRLMSEVPLGVFLSGGLDSTAVVGLMAPMLDEAIQTFSVGYPDGGAGSEMTEFAYARLAAERFNTDHRELALDPGQFWRSLPRIVWHFDEPVADAAAVPLYCLSLYAKEFVTVVLSGEGADELLAGYAVYQKMLWSERLRRIPGVGAAAQLAHPVAGRKLRRYLRGLGKPLRDRYRGVAALFSDSEAEKLLIPELRSTTQWDGAEEMYLDRTAHLDSLSQMLYFDTKVWLPDDLLVKADKMTMAASVELRVPFLDHQLVEWSSRLPSQLKLHNGVGKQLLRQAVREVVPAPILTRSKLGFPVPIGSWFERGLNGAAQSLLHDCRSADEFFERRRLDDLVRRHTSGGEDLSGEIYALMLFALWHRLYIDSSSVPVSPPPLEDWRECA